jgi:hypothetical protein
MVTLQKSDLGRGPRFLVADPGVRYRGPLRSPILTVQALVITGVGSALQTDQKALLDGCRALVLLKLGQ